MTKELKDGVFIHLCFTESVSYLPNRELDDPASHVSMTVLITIKSNLMLIQSTAYNMAPHNMCNKVVTTC